MPRASTSRSLLKEVGAPPAPLPVRNSPGAAPERPHSGALGVLSRNVEPDWWKGPVSAKHAQVLREATGLVLRDAIRFYESGIVDKEDVSALHRDLEAARDAIATLEQGAARKEEQLGNVLFDIDKRYDLQQAVLASLQRDLTDVRAQSDEISENYAEVGRELASLPDLRSENVRLHTLVNSLAKDLGLLRNDYSDFREKVEAKENARAGAGDLRPDDVRPSPAADELESARK